MRAKASEFTDNSIVCLIICRLKSWQAEPLWPRLRLTQIKAWVNGDFIKWKHFPRYWPFERGIHRSLVNSPHKGQWRGALIFFFDLRLNKRLSKQPWGWWFETLPRPLWRHSDEMIISSIARRVCLLIHDTNSKAVHWNRHGWVISWFNVLRLQLIKLGYPTLPL